MAGQQQLKTFYIALAAVAVVGVGFIAFARMRGAEQNQAQPVPVGADVSFEGHVMGSDSAPVTIVEYADFECPACAQFAVLTGPDVKRRMVATGEVRWIFRDFPIDGHPNSAVAHHAAQCAAEQGRFWEMHDQIFFNHSRWATSRRAEREIRGLAEALGLDMDRYEECMDTDRYRARLQRGKEEAAASGVSSTPTFDINGRRYSGAFPYDDLRRLVDQAIAERQ